MQKKVFDECNAICRQTVYMLAFISRFFSFIFTGAAAVAVAAAFTVIVGALVHILFVWFLRFEI